MSEEIEQTQSTVLVIERNDDLSLLTLEEQSDRNRLENTSITSLCEHWLAIAEIKNRRLYRVTDDGRPQTWEDYCRNTFGFSKQYAARLLRAAAVIHCMRETKVSVSFASVDHALALSGLDSEEMVIVTSEAKKIASLENRKPKTDDFKNARQKLLNANPTTKTKPTGDADVPSSEDSSSNDKSVSTSSSQNNQNKSDICSLSIVVEDGGNEIVVADTFQSVTGTKPEKTSNESATVFESVDLTIDQRQEILFQLAHLPCQMKLVMGNETAMATDSIVMPESCPDDKKDNNATEQISRKKLQTQFGEYALDVLGDYLDEQSSHWYRVVKPLPLKDEFEELQRVKFSASVAELVDDAFSEFECLAGELSDWYDNLPEQFQSADKGSDIEEAKSTLESLNQPEFDESIGNMSVCHFPLRKMKSRADRRDNAVGQLQSVIDALSDRNDADAQDLIAALEDVVSEVECISFPSMY